MKEILGRQRVQIEHNFGTSEVTKNIMSLVKASEKVAGYQLCEGKKGRACQKDEVKMGIEKTIDRKSYREMSCKR